MLVESIFHDAVRTAGGLFAGLALFRLLEVVLPAEDSPPPERNWLGVRIWGIYVAVQILLTAVILSLMDASGVGPRVDPDRLLGSPTWASAIIVGLAVILIKDFLFYWEHRIQHRWLWRWHAPHHAIRNLSATNSWHHWSEILMFALMVSLPLSMIVSSFGPRPLIAGLILSWQPIYLHTATRLQLPRVLRWLIIDGRYHRIHHSLEPRHFDRNFGAATPLWDWMFGTLYMPHKREWPDVGLAGIDEPAKITDWSQLPWALDRAERNATDEEATASA